jgi:polysaccharide export outer membrane protein
VLSKSNSLASPSRPLRRLGLALSLAVTVGLAPAEATEDPAQYIVGPNDVLAITIFDQPQLTGKYLVQADGTVTFPLLGRVKVGGLSMQEVENGIREDLSKGFLKNPQVGVTVDQYRSQQIFVIGEVRQPGTLEFTGSMTLIAALARAGSTSDRAGAEVVIVRPAVGAPPVLDPTAIDRAQQTNQSQVIRVDLDNLQNGVLAQNMMLRGGDTVFVPRADTVIVTGQVSAPGEHTIRKGMTVRQVLALSGGVTDRGSTGRIQIIRKIDGQDRTIGVRLQDVVQPNDTIVVRERLF